jgi:hypothetical protein
MRIKIHDGDIEKEIDLINIDVPFPEVGDEVFFQDKGVTIRKRVKNRLFEYWERRQGGYGLTIHLHI